MGYTVHQKKFCPNIFSTFFEFFFIIFKSFFQFFNRTIADSFVVGPPNLCLTCARKWATRCTKKKFCANYFSIFFEYFFIIFWPFFHFFYGTIADWLALGPRLRLLTYVYSDKKLCEETYALKFWQILSFWLKERCV